MNKTGFTLIEMLTVVLIIGLLTGIALPQDRRAIQKAQASEAVAMLGTINDSGERLAQEFGYRSLANFSSNANFTFRRMDMFDADTIACTFNAAYTQMTCDHFIYTLGSPLVAEKRNTPYQGVKIKLNLGDIPTVTCEEGTSSAGACDLYGLDAE